MEQNELQELQMLLALKRNQIPGPDYFASVLTEFHRRQRAELMQPKPSLNSWVVENWQNLMETVAFQPARVLRYACAMAFGVGLLSLGLTGQWGGQNLSLAALKPAPAATYAFDQPVLTGASDTLADEVIVGDSVASNSKALYALSESPATYDSALAF